MFNIGAIFCNFKNDKVLQKDNTQIVSHDFAESNLIFNNDGISDISSLKLSSQDAKNLEIAIALSDIGKMSGLD